MEVSPFPVTRWDGNESRLTPFKVYGRIRETREAHEALDIFCVVPSVQASGRLFFLIWGDFRSSGLGAAALYRNEIKSADYVRVGNYLSIPSMDFFFTDSESLYQDSNIKIPMIRQRKSSWAHMNLPTQTPNFNPMKNIWDVLDIH